jgi:hypothetical protein
MTIFFAYKSTDVGIFSAVYLLGLGFSKGQNGFVIERWLKRSGVVLLGFLIGQLILMYLDQIFLGDAFFSLRASSWSTLIQFNFGTPEGIIILLSKNLGILILFILFVFGMGILFFMIERKGENRIQVNLFGRSIALSSNKAVLIMGVFLSFLFLYALIAINGFNFLIENGRKWLTYLIPTIGFPFLLYLISLVKPRKSKWVAYQIICWLYPIVSLLFLVSFAGVSRRYFLPVLPTILILAAQIFDPEVPSKSANGIDTTIKVLLPSIVIASIINIPIMITMTLIVIIALSVKQERLLSLSILLTCIMLFTFPQIKYYGEPFIEGNQVQLFKRRFSPLEVSSQYVTCAGNPRVFASGNIYGEYGILSRNQGNLAIMFNLYFRCTLGNSHFTQSGGDMYLPGNVESPRKPINVDSLTSGEYTYIYLSAKDWEELSDTTKQTLTSLYNAEFLTWRAEHRLIDFLVRFEDISHIVAQELNHRTLSPRARSRTQFKETIPGNSIGFEVNKPIRIVFLYR